MHVTVIGAGVAGLTCASSSRERGATVEVLERAARLGEGSCSWFAGGMLAPWCERESAEPLIASSDGEHRVVARALCGTASHGTLVVAHGRDRAELLQFGRRTGGCGRSAQRAVAALEPELAGRFDRGLFFAGEGHLDPRAALAALAAQLVELG